MSLPAKIVWAPLALLPFLFTLMISPLAALEGGLVGYWSFDEGAGTESADLSGKDRRVVFVEDEETLPQWVEGKIGSALHFDESSYAKVEEFYGVGGNTPRTIAMWLKTDWQVPGGATALIGWGLNESGRRWHFKFEHTTQSIRTENQSGQNFGSDIEVTDGEWHHVASVLPAGGTTIGDVQLYVDGVLLDVNGNGAQTVDTATDPDEGAVEVTIGMGFLGNTKRFSLVTLDELGIWERGLSQEEIQTLVDGARPISEGDPNLVAPSKVDLGQVTAVPPTHEGVFAVRNLGEENTLEITGIDVGGTDADRFTVTDFPSSLPPGEAGEVAFVFDSRGESGGFLAEFVVKSNEEESPEFPIAVSASVINRNGPVAHYRLDESAGSEVVNDVSGWNRHGALSGNAALGQAPIAGESGTALQVSDGGQLLVSAALFDPFESFSVSTWVQPDTVGGTQTLAAYGAGTPDWAVLSVEGALAWFVAGEPKATTDPLLAAGGVAHVTVTYSTEALAIYLDGEQVLLEEDPDPVEFEADFDAFFSVGAVGTALPFAGIVDDVQLYGRTLEAEDVKWLFDNPSKPIGGPIDSDGDTLSDEDEVNIHGTDPQNPDTDGDDRTDGEEINGEIKSDPLKEDTDGDGFGDGFEIAQGTDPSDPDDAPEGIGEWDYEWHVIEALGTFDGFEGGLDRQDVTFRVWIDFREAEVSADEREMIWESGGGTVGFSLVYESGNNLVLRAAGNGGNTVTEVVYTLTSDQIAAGELPVTWTFDVDNGDAATGQTIALFVDDVLVGEASGDMDPDWTGSNGASFGAASTSFAAGGENTALANGIDFGSGTINLDNGLRMFANFLFDPGDDPMPPVPGDGPVALGIVLTADGVEIRWESQAGKTYHVEHTAGLEAWSTITEAPIDAAGESTSYEDTDSARTSASAGYYRAVEQP